MTAFTILVGGAPHVGKRTFLHALHHQMGGTSRIPGGPVTDPMALVISWEQSTLTFVVCDPTCPFPQLTASVDAVLVLVESVRTTGVRLTGSDQTHWRGLEQFLQRMAQHAWTWEHCPWLTIRTKTDLGFSLPTESVLLPAHIRDSYVRINSLTGKGILEVWEQILTMLGLHTPPRVQPPSPISVPLSSEESLDDLMKLVEEALRNQEHTHTTPPPNRRESPP
jgi:hypothetical protein